MGEKSKSSGELGEAYVANFLNLIGWNVRQSNESFKCTESEKHNTNSTKNGRTTHGIDELFSYESQMDSGMLTHAVVSVKHTDDKYPQSPNSKFKEYITDLAHTIECFEKSDLITKNRESFCVNDEQIIGVLFWISSKSDRAYSLISNLKNPTLSENLAYKRIHIMDNDRVEFITQSINLVKNKFPNHSYTFYYIDTPYNLSDSNKQYNGMTLPVEMLSSNIQLFKLTKDREIILAMVIKDEFHEDSLRRILGLAHKISNNLTSNIQIFFPFFDHATQENINTVSRIKKYFKDKEFIQTTHILGYGIGFKDTEQNIKTSQNIPKESVENGKLDDGTFLPYGEYLRSLLVGSSITDSELNTLLKAKGIYTCESTKENTIPALTSLLLSPKEFDYLKESQKTREDREKRISSRFKTEIKPTVEALQKALNKVDLKDLDKNKFKNYKYKSEIVNFQIDKAKNQLILNYEIERHQKNRCWSDQVGFFKGCVAFDCNGEQLEIIAKNINTSKETLEINKMIIDYCKSKLLEHKIISKDTKEERILIGDMTNEEILQFLLAFTNNSVLTNVNFMDIISIDIEIDETTALPSSSKIKWMEDKIKKLKLDGKKIEDIEIINDDTNHKYLKCWGLIAKYEFDNPKISGKGNALVEFKFNKSSRHNDFSVEIQKCTFDKKNYHEKNVEEMILSDVDNIKHGKHKEIMERKK